MIYLITKMKELIAQGGCLILLFDANEDMNNEKLAQAIRSEPKLKMKFLVRERAGKDGPATWFRGTNQIYCVFTRPDVDLCGAMVLPFWYGTGDHKAVVVDIPHQSLLGEQVLKVFRPEARKIQYCLTDPKRWYIKQCKTLFL